MSILWRVLAVSFVIAGTYLVFVMWAAKHTISAAPREKMFLCDKHGAFLAKHALTIIDDAIVQYTDGTEKREPLLYCPFCYEDRIAEAKRG